MASKMPVSKACRHIGGGVYLLDHGRDRLLILRPAQEFCWDHSDGLTGANRLVDLMDEHRELLRSPGDGCAAERYR